MLRVAASVLLLLSLVFTSRAGWSEVLYAADGAQGNSSRLYILDPATGAALKVVGPIGFAVTGLAIHPTTGDLYGSTSNKSPVSPGSLIKIDKTTGAGTVIGSFGFPSGCNTGGGGGVQTMADLTFTSDGTLYGWLEACDDDLFTVNLTSGQATRVADSSLNTFGGGLAANAQNTLFLAGEGDSGPLSTINPATGVPTMVATLDGTTNDSIAALAFNQAGVLYGSQIAFAPELDGKAFLITIDPATGHITTVGQTVDKLDAIAFDPNGTPPPNDMALFASALPLMRAVQFQQTTATFFVTMIVTGTGVATGCRIAPAAPIAADFLFQITDARNNLAGFPNVPENIAGGSAQTFLIAFEPTASFPATEVPLQFVCNGAGPAGVIPGVNTVIVSSTGGPDIVALAVTPTSDGIVNIPGENGAGALAVAVVNVGSGGDITVSTNTTGPLSAAFTTQAVLPVSVSLCRTDAQGNCATPIQASVTQPIDPNATPTFAIFVTGLGLVPFDPATNRIFVLFSEGPTLRGATSVAVRTTFP